MTYRVCGLDPAPFEPLFGLPDEELAERCIVRMTVNSPTFPCRVSLTDREIGERVLLLNHVSHDVANPYRASHAIFVTEGEGQAAEALSVFGRTNSHDVPNRSRNIAKRDAKKVSCIGMKICPPSESS